jgi:hypothetical protein
LIVRAWGAAVLRPCNIAEIERECLEARVGDVVDDYGEIRAKGSGGDLFGDGSCAYQGDGRTVLACVGLDRG